MAIRVTCPGCHKRFEVGDQFAGRTGPCPKCKTQIRIPTKEEEVKIHAPDDFQGVRGTSGELVLKPVSRIESKLNVVTAIGVAAACLIALIAAVVVRVATDADPSWFPTLALGAVLLAPPLVFGGYLFLRDEELEPYRGGELYIRVGACALSYALLWGAYGVIEYSLSPGGAEFSIDVKTNAVIEPGPGLPIYQLVFVAPMVMGLGALAAYASLDLNWGNAFFHYALYLAVTAALRLITGPQLVSFG